MRCEREMIFNLLMIGLLVYLMGVLIVVMMRKHAAVVFKMLLEVGFSIMRKHLRSCGHLEA